MKSLVRPAKLVSVVVLLAILPAAMIFLTFKVKQSRGPYWLGANSDPDYVYLLNALAVSQGERPSFADHPGTPAIYLYAAMLRLTSWSRPQDSLVEEVLRDPEWYLQALNHAMLVICAAVVAALGAVTYWVTRNLFLALVVELVSSISDTMIFDSLPSVNAEPLLFAISLSIAVLCLIATEQAPRQAPLLSVCFGLLLGLAVATKITALPLVVLPLMILPSRTCKVRFVVLFLVALFLGTLPVFSKYQYFAHFLYDVFSHTGDYGSGAKGFVDLAKYVEGLQTLFLLERQLGPQCALNVALLIFSLIYRKKKPHSLLAERSSKLLLAITLVEMLQVLLVAKSPCVRYLVPVVGLFGVNIVVFLRPILQVPRRLVWLVAIGISVILLWSGPGLTLYGFQRNRRSFWRERESQLRVSREVKENHAGAKVILHYGASSVYYALWFGNFGVGDECRAYQEKCTRFIEVLKKLYPEALFYDSTGAFWDPKRTEGIYWNWSERVPFKDIVSGQQEVIFQGKAFCFWNCRPPGVSLDLIFPKGTQVPEDSADYSVPEVVYRLKKNQDD